MKDLYTALKNNHTTKTIRKIAIEKTMVDAKNEMQLTSLIAQIDKVLVLSKNELEEAAKRFNIKLVKVDFDKLGKAMLDDNLELESRFYSLDKRSVELKIFVRVNLPNGKTHKVARSNYTFIAEFNGKKTLSLAL